MTAKQCRHAAQAAKLPDLRRALKQKECISCEVSSSSPLSALSPLWPSKKRANRMNGSRDLSRVPIGRVHVELRGAIVIAWPAPAEEEQLTVFTCVVRRMGVLRGLGGSRRVRHVRIHRLPAQEPLCAAHAVRHHDACSCMAQPRELIAIALEPTPSISCACSSPPKRFGTPPCSSWRQLS